MNCWPFILVAVAAYCYGSWRGWHCGYRAASDLHRWLAEKPKVARRVERGEFENVN